MGELHNRIREGFPEVAARDDFFAALEACGEFDEVVVWLTAFKPAGSLSVEGAGAFLFQAFFYLVDAADEQKDAGGDAGVIAACFFEFPTDVGKAGDGGDVECGVALDEGAVSA